MYTLLGYYYSSSILHVAKIQEYCCVHGTLVVKMLTQSVNFDILLQFCSPAIRLAVRELSGCLSPYLSHLSPSLTWLRRPWVCSTRPRGILTGNSRKTRRNWSRKNWWGTGSHWWPPSVLAKVGVWDRKPLMTSISPGKGRSLGQKATDGLH